MTRTPGKGVHLESALSMGSFGFVNPSLTASYGTQGIAVPGGFSYRSSDPYRDGAGKLFTGLPTGSHPP